MDRANLLTYRLTYVPIFIHFCRKDWILGIICLCIILIGVPIIGVKKYMHQKLIHKIPRSNIVNPVTTISKELSRTCRPPQPILNTTKYNKNLINFTGVLVLGSSFAMIGMHVFGSRLGWIHLRYGEESYLFTFANLYIFLKT